MKKYFPIGQRTDVFAVFSLVGHIHDGRMRRSLVMLQGVCKLAESLGKLHLLHIIKILLAKQQHAVIVPCAFDRSEGCIVECF